MSRTTASLQAKKWDIFLDFEYVAWAKRVPSVCEKTSLRKYEPTETYRK